MQVIKWRHFNLMIIMCHLSTFGYYSPAPPKYFDIDAEMEQDVLENGYLQDETVVSESHQEYEVVEERPTEVVKPVVEEKEVLKEIFLQPTASLDLTIGKEFVYHHKAFKAKGFCFVLGRERKFAKRKF